MELCFNEKKATQSAALFLKIAEQKMNFMVLIKYLYLMERKALSTWGRSVTYDTFYSMKNGPVLSKVLDLIHEEPPPDEPRYWPKFISPPSNYKVELNEDPGTDSLSVAEKNLIHKIFEEYKDYLEKPFGFVTFLHGILPEWERRDSGRSLITIESMLHANNKSSDEIKEVEEELRHLGHIQSVFGTGF